MSKLETRQNALQGAQRLQDAPEASVARFMCGLMAGTLAKLATHPLDVAKKRFQVCCHSSLETSRGAASLRSLRLMVNCTYHLLNHFGDSVMQKDLKIRAILICDDQSYLYLSGLQVAGLQRSAAYGERIPVSVIESLPRCIMQIYSREGLRGLYKGASLSIVKAAPASAITLTVYEFLAIHFIEYLHNRERTAVH